MAAAEAADRPASQVVREFMREFVLQQRDERAYDAFVRRKVEAARRSIQAGHFYTSEEVEAEFAAKRAGL